MKFIRLMVLVLGLFFHLFVWSSPVKTERIDGVEHVYNSAQPLKGSLLLQLKEGLKIDADHLGGDNYIFIAGYALSPDRHIFIFDGKTRVIYKFNARGEFLLSFQINKGEGPGEFTYISEMFAMKNQLWLKGGPRKIALFDLQGRFVTENKLTGRYRQFKMIPGNRLIAVKSTLDKEAEKVKSDTAAIPQIQKLVLEDTSTRQLVNFFQSRKTGGWMNAWIQFRDARITPMIFYDYDQVNHLLAYSVSDDYSIFIRDLTGKLIRVVHRYVEKTAITGSHLQQIFESRINSRLIEIMKTRMNKDLKAMIRNNLTAKYLGIIKDIQFIENGMIAVYRSINIQEHYVLDIFDQKGRFVYTLNLPEFLWDLRQMDFHSDKICGIRYDREEDLHYYIQYEIQNLPRELGSARLPR